VFFAYKFPISGGYEKAIKRLRTYWVAADLIPDGSSAQAHSLFIYRYERLLIASSIDAVFFHFFTPANTISHAMSIRTSSPRQAE
jgi:hypothetical protein